MPDTDKILEAEQSIQNIASELKRMRDAANLLQSAQEQTAAVIDGAQQLTQETKKFSSSCGTVIDKIASVDLGQKLNDLKTMHDELGTVIKSQSVDLGQKLNDLKTTHDELGTVIKSQNEEARVAARGAKIRQVTMIVCMVIALIALLAILLKI